jgi:Sec-independent protein translocase protein TatA
MGFGAELLLILTLAVVVLGPKRLQSMLGHVARAKAELDTATCGIRSQFGADLDAAPREGKTDASHELARDQ